ncbi:MAG TPA: pentapeptide repeat-containing protein [Ktedonobacteraceae bacterium]|nr:pentapeptide repeat-containing protein [Ktedonobacteraceae bacterium]
MTTARAISPTPTKANLIGSIYPPDVGNPTLNLYGADLSGAFLRFAGLRYAIIRGADLSDVNLSEAFNLDQQQLDQVYTCKGAILPQGLVCRHNL